MTTGTSPGILHDIRIVDLSDGIAGPIATLLLAEAGADVVMVEPPDGNTTRSVPGFRTWGRSKRCVVVDVHDAFCPVDGDRDFAHGAHRAMRQSLSVRPK